MNLKNRMLSESTFTHRRSLELTCMNKFRFRISAKRAKEMRLPRNRISEREGGREREREREREKER